MMQEWMLASAIVLFASALQALTGFGFAIIATPLLLLIFNSLDSIQISILLSFLIAVILIPKVKQGIEYCLFRRLALGSVVGIPFGIVIFSLISIDNLKMVIGVIVLVITSFSLYNQYINRTNETLNGKTTVQFSPNTYWELLVGFLSGIFTASVGMPGVPLVLYFVATGIPKETIRSTTLAFFGVVYIFCIIMQMVTVKIAVSVVANSLFLVPSAILGVIIGHWLFPKVDQSLFLLITNIILVYTAVYMLIGSYL